MQLKIKRSQRNSQGLIASKLLYVLDARAELTAEEMSAAQRYGLMSQVIYNSQASKDALAKSNAHLDQGSWGGIAKSFAYTALAAANVNITIGGLIKGTHVECKDLDELLGAEEALMDACKNLRGYLETAKTFDGREVIFDFTKEEPVLIAPGAVVKSPELAPPAALSPTPGTAPMLAAVPASPVLLAPLVPERPAITAVRPGEIPPVPNASVLPPLPKPDEPVPAAASKADALPAEVIAKPAPAAPTTPPVPAPNTFAADPAYSGPGLTRLSDGSYSTQPDYVVPPGSDFMARAKESFGRLTPLQQGGVAVGAVVIFVTLVKMFFG